MISTLPKLGYPRLSVQCCLVSTVMGEPVFLAVTFSFPIVTLPKPHSSGLTFTLLHGLTCAFALQEEWLLKKDIRCSSRLLPRAWDLQQLQVSWSWTQAGLSGWSIWVQSGPPFSCFSNA